MLKSILLRRLCRVKHVHSKQSSSVISGSPDELSLNAYQEASDDTLEDLCEKLDAALETRYDQGADVTLSSGVLTVVIDNQNTFVINKQTPNRQIWLSSPISGPKRFDYVEGDWLERNSRVNLKRLLSEELSSLLKHKVEC